MLEQFREILRGARIDSKDSERLLRLITRESEYSRNWPILDLGRANLGDPRIAGPSSPYPGATYKVGAASIEHFPLTAEERAGVEEALDWFRGRYGS